jgi:hypothetical protein
MQTSLRSRLGRFVVVALIVVGASVIGTSWVVADGDPPQPIPKPLFCCDLSAPAEVVMGVVTASWYFLDATAF